MIQKFEDNISKQIEEQMQDRLGMTAEQVEIADVQFGFDNAQLLRMLEQRASLLRSAKIDKADEVEQQMTVYKNENLERLTRPNSAYCTFKNKEAFNRLLSLQ